MKSLRPFLLQLSYYLIFHILIWALHLLVLSIVSFFHFNLGHSMSIIDDWIFSKAWGLSFISKIIGSIVIMKFLLIKSNFRKPMRNIIINSNNHLSSKILVLMIFIIVSVIYLGRPVFTFQEHFEFVNTCFSFIGLLIFFSTDIMIVFFLDHFYPINKKYSIIRILTFPLIFLFFTKSTFYLNKDNLIFLYFYSLVLFVSFSFVKSNWVNAFSILLLVLAPINAIFGIDIMWGSHFSPFIFKEKLQYLEISILSVLVCLYWYFFPLKSKIDR